MLKVGLLCVIVSATDKPSRSGYELIMIEQDPARISEQLISDMKIEGVKECLSRIESSNQWVKRVMEESGWVVSSDKVQLVGGKIPELCHDGSESVPVQTLLWMKNVINVESIKTSYKFDEDLMWLAVLIRDCGVFTEKIFTDAKWYLIPQYSNWPYFAACKREFDEKIDLIRRETVEKLKQVGMTDLSPDSTLTRIQESRKRVAADSNLRDKFVLMSNEVNLRYIVGPMEAANLLLNSRGYRILVDATDNVRSVRLLQPLGVFLTPGMGKLRKLARELIDAEPKLVRDNALMRPSRLRELEFLIGPEAAEAKMRALIASASSNVREARALHLRNNEKIAAAKVTVVKLNAENKPPSESRTMRADASLEIDVPVGMNGVKGAWKTVKALMWESAYECFKRFIKSTKDPYSLVSFVDEDLLILAMGGSVEKAHKLMVRRAAIAVEIMHEESRTKCNQQKCQFAKEYEAFLKQPEPKDLVGFLQTRIAPNIDHFPDIVTPKCHLGLVLMIGAAQAAILARDGLSKSVVLKNDLTRIDEYTSTFQALRPSEKAIQKAIAEAWTRERALIESETNLLIQSPSHLTDSASGS